MTRNELINQIKLKSSYLCIGLDTDINKIPKHLLKLSDPIFAFNKEIIDATKDLCVSYKLNLAFYESLGSKGWQSLERTVDYLPKESFKIADAKRGDIGNTAEMYAKAFFETMNFDAVTLSPYMGRDSILPFLNYKDKWAIVLGLTSNKGSADFQTQFLKSGVELYKEVICETVKIGNKDNLMFVVGATNEEQFTEIRKLVPEHFLLVPGIGTQGGNLKEVSKRGLVDGCGLLINSSRSVIYSSSAADFAETARKEALNLQFEMKDLLISNAIFNR